MKKTYKLLIFLLSIIPSLNAQVILNEGFESDTFGSLISFESVGTFTSSPRIKDNTNFGSAKVFGFGRSACASNCFDNFRTTFIITFPVPTYVESIMWKEMEIGGNWGSQGVVLLDNIILGGATLGALPVNSGVPDAIPRNRTFSVNQIVRTIKLVITDITSSSEIIIDDFQVTTQLRIAGYEYWYNDDFANKTATAVAPTQQLLINKNVSTTGLAAGINVLNFRSYDSSGKFSSTLSSFFYKVPENAISARKVVTYEYWFDSDYANKISQNATNQETFSLNTNVVPNGLTNGIHTFNIRFKDNTGFLSSTLSSFFFKVPAQSTVDRKIVAYEYWFDSDYTNKISQTATNQETFSINTNIVPNGLASGIHTFNIRFKDNTGFLSSTLSSFFYKVPAQANVDRKIVAYEYWFDSDYTNKISQTATNQETFSINTNVVPNGLASGIHTFNIRFKDNTGFLSSTLSSFFYKVPTQTNVDRKIAAYEYWFDNDYTNRISQTATNQETFSLNTNVVPNGLPNGIHTFNIRFKDNTGFLSSTLSSFFYKVPEQAIADRKIIAYEYWFDSDYANVVSQTATNQETFSLNTNVVPSTLANGIHTFNIRFKDNTGFSSSTLSSFFYKNQNGSIILKNIVAYEYWFDDDYSKAVLTKITPHQIANINTFVIPENSNLGAGNHLMNIRFRDDSGLWSSISSNEFGLIPLGIEDRPKLENVVVYPNPTTGMITIDLAANYEDIKLLLYDMHGRLLKQQSFENKKSFDFEMNQAAGVYLISIESENRQSSFRIIKK